jgi:hypothetical protein
VRLRGAIYRFLLVIPAKAGIQLFQHSKIKSKNWIPACAGMTGIAAGMTSPGAGMTSKKR